MEKQFCSACGSEIKESSKFCPSCGHPVAHASQPQQVNHAPQMNKPNKNKLYAIIAGVIVIGLVLFFWQKDAPEDVAEKFFGHIMEFDLEKAEKLISSEAESSVREDFQEMSAGLDSLPVEFSGEMKMKHTFKVLNVEKSGNEATVHAEISFLDDMFTDEAYFELVKEKGSWKVLFIE